MKPSGAKYLALPTWGGQQWEVRVEDYDYHHWGDTVPREGRLVDQYPRTWPARSIHRMRARDPHSITALHRSPTWTLVLAGRRAPEPAWGYWDETGWTPWDKHPHAAEFADALAARQEQAGR